jgi:amicyanin
MRKAGIIAIVVGLLIVAAALAIMTVGKSDKNETSNKPTDTMPSMQQDENSDNTATQPKPNEVIISNYAYAPQKITVKVGTTVTWTNKDSIEHTVTADTKSADAPKSELIAKGQTYSFTFNKAGTYDYHCEPHPYMKGTVVVTQ